MLADSPVQLYRLNETAGPAAADSSGNSANGSYVGSLKFGQPGPLLDESSTAIAIAGGSASAGVSVPNPNAPSGSSFTIEAWVYPVQTSNYKTIFGYDGAHRLLVSSAGLLLTQFNGNFFSKTALTPNAWHDVVFEYDAAARTASYYIDGVFDSSISLSPTSANFVKPYYLGQYDTSSNYKWNGRLAEFAFYRKALTATQIGAHYSAAGYPAPAPTPSPAPSASASPRLR